MFLYHEYKSFLKIKEEFDRYNRFYSFNWIANDFYAMIWVDYEAEATFLKLKFPNLITENPRKL